MANVKKANNASELVKELNGGYRMSLQEIADCVGVTKALVFWWKEGKNYPNEEHYEKLSEMCLRLSAAGVRYPRQGYEVLMEGR